MFGYVKTFTPELKVCEHEYYKAVYCGLCKTLGKNYGLLSRMTLSYDFAFLALIYADLKNETPKAEKCRCIIHPCKNKNCVNNAQALDFSAACAMIMLYYKILDNIRDNNFFKKTLWKIALLFFKGAYKKAQKAYPKLNEIISREISRQGEIENKCNVSPDEAADPTACAMREILREIKNDDNVARFGYLLGRWVYLIDAFDDFESDNKKGNFNAFKTKQLAKESCNQTSAELQNAYSALKLGKFAPIISNIVFLGLNDSLRKAEKNG